MASALLSPALGPPSDDEVDGEADMIINEDEYRNIDSPRYHVDPDGDLVLKITDHAKHTHLFSTVSREALIRASKVFRNTIADNQSPTNSIIPGGYTSPHHDGPEAVTKDLLHVEDDFASLIAILASIHKNTALVPQNVSYDQLLNLAVTCDKYEISTRFLKSANRYIESVTSGNSSNGSHTTTTDGGRENLIFIADVFNREALAQRLCERLADTIELPGARGGSTIAAGNKEYTRYNSDECNLDRVPQSYIDAILRHRKTQLSFIFDQVKAYERFLSQTSPASSLTTRFLTVYTTYPTSEISEFLDMLKGCNTNCGASMYGSFVRQLKTAGLASYIVCDEDCSNWPWSVERALSIIHGLDFMHGDKECYLAKETEVEEGRRAFVNCPYYHVSRHRRIFRSRQKLEIPFKSTMK